MRNISVFGDSISTLEGFQPAGYRVFYTDEMQKDHEIGTVWDMWWSKVISALNGTLCVNNSYSGCKVSGEAFPSANTYDRIMALKSDLITPDVILVYLGVNDFGNGVRIRDNDQPQHDLLSFAGAYRVMLQRLHQVYPLTVITCGTLCRTYRTCAPNWTFPEEFAGVPFEEYNRVIRETAAAEQCCLADLAAFNEPLATLDGSHPTKEGQQRLADLWLRCLKS